MDSEVFGVSLTRGNLSVFCVEWASVMLCYPTVLLCILLQYVSRWLSVTAGQHWFDLGKTVGPEFLENILL